MKPRFSSDALNPGVRFREVFGWAMYDFANSGYTTVVITAVFAAYFVGGVAQGASWATLAWTVGLSISYAIVMLTMPGLGAWADRTAGKKRLLMAVTAACVFSTAALAWVGPGQVVLGLCLLIISNTFFSFGESLTASFLPELARPEAMGRVSGWGWALGYIGGMLTLGVCLAYVMAAQARGESGSQFVPVTMLITAVVYGAAACVTFALMKEHSPPQPDAPVVGMLQSLRQLKQTFRDARPYKDFTRSMACAVAYQGGVAVAISLAAIYAEQVIGFQPQETMVLIFVLNIAAFVGAFVLGYAQDRIGHKLALALTLLGWILTCVIAALSSTKEVFWWAAALAGVCMGSSQSSGRAMAGLMVPPARLGEFFGLWTFAIRLASILGPLSYGLITWLSGGNQRLAIGSTSLLFVLGLVLLMPVSVERGRRMALGQTDH
ncbi:MFS transporter [Limnohabitans sp. MMS-10A-160]|uniref:MFS transporter n=1 Tax=unclassified Limnohabitans TaxID=2626134 RepID=UPI000D33D7B9|nr:MULTISPECIES: MFS transporter [unclassified Limnohabitans]PUE22336.1 MFS transporter [Limnohabitans sp. MMS-10A-192]PUE25984.1 MFS transporter [Limnohabitans sp. MMS-10A-160]